MKCADPVLCYIRSDGKRIYRHWSLASKLVRQFHHLVFDCGKCLFCRKKKAYELACRCVLHASIYEDNCFLTLTYDESKPGYNNDLQYSDIQNFKKRLRQYCKRKYDKRIEVYNVHEYGKRGKKHWHLIVFNHDFEDKTLFTVKNNISIYTSKKLETLWPFGFNTIGNVTEASAMYQSQYCEKDFRNGNITNGKRSKSNHSGIGRAYFLKNYKQILRLGYIPVNGGKLPVPRYFEKLAHKHYSHFYHKSNFFDKTDGPKALYRPFKNGEANKELADLYVLYMDMKDSKILDLQKEWDGVISQYLTTGRDPDFIKSASNAKKDLKTKRSTCSF